MRAFSPTYYNTYSWLEYSIIEDKIFCFVCRQFLTGLVKDQNESFVRTGFCNWKKLVEKLAKHGQSASHADCSKKYIDFKLSAQSGGVAEQVKSQHAEKVTQNKKYLEILADISLFLARQGLAFRGHRENKEANNRGNFLEISEIFAKYDQNFSNHFQRQNNYCSHQYQNEFVNIAANHILKEISREVHECGFFSLMVDEAKCHKREQLSVAIRFVKELVTEERFLGFIDCSTSRDAESLNNLIIQFLREVGLSDLPIIGQSYDGASVMSGRHQGIQAKIKEVHEQAIFVHCLAHRVNLVVKHSCSNFPSISRYFNTLECLHEHYSQPGNHAAFLEVAKNLGIKKIHEFGSLSSTRWACRYENNRAILSNYDVVVTALEEEINLSHDKDSVTAVGILAQIMKPDFLVSMFTFRVVLSTLNHLSKYFQGKDATLGRSKDLIEATISTFETARNEFDGLWSEIESFAAERDISLEPTSTSRKRKVPRKLDDYLVNTSVGHSDMIEMSSDSSARDYWKINYYYCVMDSIIGQLRSRFETLPLAAAVDCLLELDLDGAREFIDNYEKVLNVDKVSLRSEAAVMRNTLKNKAKAIN